MDCGRIQAIVIASSAGNVVYERFYDKFSEQDKAEMRACLAESAEERLQDSPGQTEFVSRWRWAKNPYSEFKVIWHLDWLTEKLDGSIGLPVAY